jgi:D-sedoheptulose 7-phosphate isomerase
MPERSDIRTREIVDLIDSSLRASAEVSLQTIDACRREIEEGVRILIGTYRKGGKVLFCGNGGSAADCQHLATELMIRLSHDLKRPALGAISLCTDPSNLTAGGNDIGFENVFARNVEGLGRRGDTLVAISTSGRSLNIVRAIERARDIGMQTIGLTGMDGGSFPEICDCSIIVPSSDIQRIQETHITIGHILCEGVERQIFA